MKLTLTAGAAAFAALALAGCSYVNPITTHENYAASDGTQLVESEVQGLNLIVITEGEGEPGTLIGTLHNGSDEDVEVQITFDNENVSTVDVAAGEDARLGPDEGATEVSGTALVQPGLVTTVTFVTDLDGSFTVDVPVLDGTLPEYQPVIDAIG